MDLKDLKIERKPAAKRRRGNPWPMRIVGLTVLAGATWLLWPLVSDFSDRLRLPEVRTFLVTEATPVSAAAVRGTAANGYLVAARRAALSSDVPGRIVELSVKEGSIVKEGDIVARLFADEYRAAWQQTVGNVASAATAVKRAEANVSVTKAEIEEANSALQTAKALHQEGETQLTFAEQEFTRMSRLADTGIEGVRRKQLAERDRDTAAARLSSLLASIGSSQARLATTKMRAEVAAVDVQAAKDRLASAKSARDQAKATLDKTDVRAPFDGIVVLKDAEVGEVVSPNVQGGSNARGAVCTMVDFDSLEVQANVPETTLASVEVGAPADVFLDAFDSERFAGIVDRIWPTADRQKATVEVRVRLLKKDERMRPEMGVRIVFRGKDEGATRNDAEAVEATASRRIIVPAEALVQIGGKTGAFVVERGTVRFAQVSAGEAKSGSVAIDAGLTANQRIVLDPPTSLQDGDRIRLETQ